MFEKYVKSFSKIGIEPIKLVSKTPKNILHSFILFLIYKVFFFNWFRFFYLLAMNKDIKFCFIQNLYPYFGSKLIFYLQKLNIKVFFRISNYRLICPNSTLFRNNYLCNECVNGNFLNVLKYNCENNLFKSIYSYIKTKDLNKINTQKINFIVQSEYQKKFFKSLSKFKFSKFIVISNYIEENISLSKINLPYQNFFLLSGRDHLTKGFSEIIEFFKNNSKFNLIITAEPNETYKKHKNISFIGFRKRNENLYLISKSKGLIFNSLWMDISPNVLLEAMFLKKIIISKNIASLKNILIKNKTFMEFKCDKTLKINLNNILVNNYDQNIINNAFNLVKSEFSEDHFLKNLKKSYLLNSH